MFAGFQGNVAPTKSPSKGRPQKDLQRTGHQQENRQLSSQKCAWFFDANKNLRTKIGLKLKSSMLACFQHHGFNMIYFLQISKYALFGGIFFEEEKIGLKWTSYHFDKSQAGSPKRRLAWFFWMVNIPGTTRSWEKIGARSPGWHWLFWCNDTNSVRKKQALKTQTKQVPKKSGTNFTRFFTRFRQHALMFDSTFADWILFHVAARWIGRGRVTY